MKSISQIVDSLGNEEFNPSLSSHKAAYNSFIKWYDKQINNMSKNEILDMLKFVCAEIENDSLDSM